MATEQPQRSFSVFAMPLVPGQAATVRRMHQEALGARRGEYEESRRRLGITDGRGWI